MNVANDLIDQPAVVVVTLNCTLPATIDIGSTLAVTASVAIVTGQVQLNVAVPASSTGWNVKATATYL